MKNNTEDKRKDSLKAKLLKALKITLIVIFSSACLTGLGILLWYKVIRTNKVNLSEAIPKMYAIERISKYDFYGSIPTFSGPAFIAYNYDSNITDDVFTTYFGYERFDIPKPVHSIRMMKEYVTGTFEGCTDDDFPSYVVLGIDPYAAFKQSCSNRELYLRNIDFINDIASSHPATLFFVILPEDHADMWNSLTVDKKEDARLSYILLVRNLADNLNIRFFYYSLEEWVLYSECIRESGSDSLIREDICSHLLALDISDPDSGFLMTKGTVNALMDSMLEMADSYAEARDSYADLTGKKIFFLGDSIFGNFRDETSVPAFFRDMTQAKVYNLGQGGMDSVGVINPTSAMGTAFSYLTGHADREAFDRAFSNSDCYGAFRLAATDLAGTDGKDSVFIVEYGLNEYFNGVSVNDYSNALNRIISDIKGAYPAAEILILSPGYIHMYNDGEMSLSEHSSPLQDYRDAAYEAAEANGCGFLSQTDDFGFTQEDTGTYLLPDYVHYNEIGRYRLAQGLARYFK
jgi:hypothetical protein